MADEATTAPVADAPPAAAAAPQVAAPITSSGSPLDMDALAAEVDADLDRAFGPRAPGKGPADANPVRDEKGRFRPKAAQPSGPTPPHLREQPAAEPEAVSEQPAAAEPVVEPAPVAEAAAPAPPVVDEDAARREVLERIEREERERRDNEAAATRARAEAEAQQRSFQAYLGPQDEYDALREALDDDDDVNAVQRVAVTDPRTGQKTTGLSLEQAKSLMRSWNTARKHQNTLEQIAGQRILGSWGASLQAAVRGDPDLDPALLEHVDPAAMVRIVKQSTEAAVTKRLTTAHQAETAALQKRISEQAERIKDLETDGANRPAREWASTAATPDAPGRGGGVRRTPMTVETYNSLTPEEYASRSEEVAAFEEQAFSRQSRRLRAV